MKNSIFKILLFASFAFIYTGCNKEDNDASPTYESKTTEKGVKSNQKSSVTVYNNFDMNLYESTVLNFYAICPNGIVILEEDGGVHTLTLDCNGGTNPSGDKVIYRGGSQARAEQVQSWILNNTIIGYVGCKINVGSRTGVNGQTIWETWTSDCP